jgi:hypothetical protein
MNSTIEKILRDSFVTGVAIGIKLKDNASLIATAVTFYDPLQLSKWIEIKPYTLYGYPVKETAIEITQIESAMFFSVYYDDPLYVKLRELRSKIFEIK